MNDIILYTTEDGRSRIKLRTDQNTAWLTQLEMAELFDTTKQNISLHLKNIFEDGELDGAGFSCQRILHNYRGIFGSSNRGKPLREATVKDCLTVQIEGSQASRSAGRSRAGSA